MRKHQRVLATAMASAMAISLVACGGSTASSAADSTDAPAASTEAASTDSTASDEPITLTLMDQFVEGEGMSEAFRARMEVFQAEHPNVTIEEETLNTADMGTKVQTLAAADELPDIFQVKGQMAKNFVQNGYVMDLTDILNENSDWKAGFRDGVFSNFQIGDGTYAVPYQVTNTMVFYNADLFEKAGVTEFPTTWSELIDVCAKLNASGVTAIELGDSPLWPAESVIMSTLGNRCTGDDWYQSIRNNEGAKFTDPEFVLSLQSLYDLAASGAFNSDVNSIDGAAQRTAFMNGEAAMMFDGSWAVAQLDANMDPEMKANVKLAPMPAVEGGKGDAEVITGGSGWGFAVNSKLDESKRQVVVDFLTTIVGTDFATQCASSGVVSAYNPGDYTLDDSAVVAKTYFDFIDGRRFIPVYDHQLSSGLMDVMQSGLQEILNNTKDAQTLAEELQQQYEMENG